MFVHSIVGCNYDYTYIILFGAIKRNVQKQWWNRCKCKISWVVVLCCDEHIVFIEGIAKCGLKTDICIMWIKSA